MKKNMIIVLATLALVVSVKLACMEKKVIIPGMQKMLIIPCLDGEVERRYELEMWKARESISLYRHCLWYNKTFELADGLLEIPKIPVQYKTLELFSRACDVMPGEQFKKFFFKELSSEQQAELIVATGPVDKNGKRQFNAPGLIAQVFGVCFKQDWCHQHIKPLLQREVWIEHCFNKVVNNNVTISFFPNKVSVFNNENEMMEHENGKLSIVPLCLAPKGSLYDGSYTVIEKTIHNEMWEMLRHKKIDNDWEYCITSLEAINSVNEAPDNKAIIWAINNSNKNISKTVIEHKDKILKFFFSNNGEYVITRSQTEVCVSKIMHAQDGSANFDTYRIDYDEYIMDVCFDNHSNRLITCAAGNTGIVKLFDISGTCIARMERLGLVEKAVLSPDGKKLLILSHTDKPNIFTLCTITNNIYSDAKFVIPGEENTQVDRIICSPNGSHWAVTTKTGGIIFIRTYGDQCKGIKLVENSVVNSKKDMRMLFSSDSRFLIALVQKSIGDLLMLEIWSTLSGQKIASQYSFCGQELDLAIGLTPQDRELVCFYGNGPAYTRSFCSEQDDTILSHLWNATTIYWLSLLRRLCRAHKIAHKNKESVELYEEEPAHKALINMQKKPLDVVGFVQKYLSWKVINNKKAVGKLLQEIWNNFKF